MGIIYVYVCICMYVWGDPPRPFLASSDCLVTLAALDAAAGSRGLWYRAISDEKGHHHPAYASHARLKPSLKQQFDRKCWNTGFLVDGLFLVSR